MVAAKLQKWAENLIGCPVCFFVFEKEIGKNIHLLEHYLPQDKQQLPQIVTVDFITSLRNLQVKKVALYQIRMFG